MLLLNYANFAKLHLEIVITSTNKNTVELGFFKQENKLIGLGPGNTGLLLFNQFLCPAVRQPVDKPKLQLTCIDRVWLRKPHHKNFK